MAYFPNGTSGLMFSEDQCVKCQNYRDKDDGRGYGCAVMDVHLLFNYDQVGEDEKAKALRACLSTLIPEDGVHAGECAMFLDDGRDHLTLTLPGIEKSTKPGNDSRTR